MIANFLWSWIKKWGLWILLGLGVFLFLLTRLLPSDGKKPVIIQRAKDRAKKYKEEASVKLADHNALMEANRKELEEIKKIECESERLKKLAEFANRRGHV